MLGISDLKEQIKITETTVECPAIGCVRHVMRQRKRFVRDSAFECPDHKIFISPSTFEYQSELDNLLWSSPDDLELLRQIKTVKRESRMFRDNSEDATTWNVIRFLETTGLVNGWLSSISGQNIGAAQIVYWSFRQSEQNSWSVLDRARNEFGEAINRGSEPDIIIVADKTLFFIEAKVTAKNETKPSNIKSSKAYLTGGNQWFQEVFITDYNTIAVEQQKYELLRFWLLGTWMAKQLGLKFILANLVLSAREQSIENVFGKHIHESDSAKFIRITWESIYGYILQNASSSAKSETVLKFFKNKSIGYDSSGGIQAAFSL